MNNFMSDDDDHKEVLSKRKWKNDFVAVSKESSAKFKIV